MKANVTGSGGLIGSACVRLLSAGGWKVAGIDNDMRSAFFGPEGSTKASISWLREFCPVYEHRDLDIRDRQAIRDLFREQKPDLIIHTAAQPSHDKAASIAYDDF